MKFQFFDKVLPFMLLAYGAHAADGHPLLHEDPSRSKGSVIDVVQHTIRDAAQFEKQKAFVQMLQRRGIPVTTLAEAENWFVQNESHLNFSCLGVNAVVPPMESYDANGWFLKTIHGKNWRQGEKVLCYDDVPLFSTYCANGVMWGQGIKTSFTQKPVIVVHDTYPSMGRCLDQQRLEYDYGYGSEPFVNTREIKSVTTTPCKRGR